MMKHNAIRKTYLNFAKQAQYHIQITDQEHYEEALALIESLILEVDQDPNHFYNGLIDLLSRAVALYESQDPDFVEFERDAQCGAMDVVMLRMLMAQYHLTGSDLPEIGSKSLVSKILSGERQLTKQHIEKLAKRFEISPSLFFAVNN